MAIVNVQAPPDKDEIVQAFGRTFDCTTNNNGVCQLIGDQVPSVDGYKLIMAGLGNFSSANIAGGIPPCVVLTSGSIDPVYIQGAANKTYTALQIYGLFKRI